MNYVAAFITIGTAAGIVFAWFKSFAKMTKRFQALEKHTQENRDTNKILCKGMLYLLRHARTGNSVDEIKQVEDELVVHLAEK